MRSQPVLATYPADSSAPVLSIICSQDFKEDIGISAIFSELQETGEATHSKLQAQQKMSFHISQTVSQF